MREFQVIFSEEGNYIEQLRIFGIELASRQ